MIVRAGLDLRAGGTVICSGLVIGRSGLGSLGPLAVAFAGRSDW